ncbi:unnamed protein product [Ceutorhynchus assimilis]|uniref:Uncharacterized protein n=1 Tax=Ceutorhynchus assimilis TaxID=467358 RepID=A0A9N9QRG6_9CUCU|nr:unnamed protein product [Ceutorhynchus assimilis]
MSTTITPVCRLCLEVIAKGKTFYNIDQENGLPAKVQNLAQNIREIISFCIPEVDTYLSLNPSICDTCLNNLVQIYNHKKNFMKIEDIIRRHSKVNPIGNNYVDLCTVVKHQYALALKDKKLTPAAIQAQMGEMNLILKNATKIVPSYGLNVMAQNHSDTEPRASPSSSKTSNNSTPSKYSLRHHVPSLLAASSSRPQPPIDLDNPQNSFLGSLNLISSENPSASNQGSAPKTGNKKMLIRRVMSSKAKPKRKINPAASADNTIIILDDDSDAESITNIVGNSKNNTSKSDDSNEVLVMNYVEQNDTGARSTATADNSSSAVLDPATTDVAEPPIIAAKPTPKVIHLGRESITAVTTKTGADDGISTADSGTPISTRSRRSAAKAVTNVATHAVDDTTPKVMNTESADGAAATTADVLKNSVVGAAPDIIMLDDKSHKLTPRQKTLVSSASEKPKTAEKNVVVKLLPFDLEDLKRKAAGEKCHEEETPSKRKKVLTVSLNPSLPYLHKNKKLIVKIDKKQFLTCELCDFVTNQGKDAIKQHGLRKHRVCMLCDYQCSSPNLLHKHFTNHHYEEINEIINKSKEENDTINCDLCSYTAVSGFDFRDHIVRKHCGDNGSTGNITLQCPYKNCGQKYDQTFHMARHVEVNHVLAKKLTCVLCNQKCHSKQGIKNHLQSHKPSGITCLLCGMSFRYNSLLRTHAKNKHPGIDADSNIAGMAHDSHDNLTADDNGHITLDSFVNRSALSNEETGANRGTLVTDKNGRIVLSLPRPNELITDPNFVVNLDERCSFEYPSLSEMLCESSFLEQNQEDECAEVQDEASKPKTRKRKRKSTVPKKNKKSEVPKPEDDKDDCVIIDKEIVTVDVSDEEALLISDDDDCTIVDNYLPTATASNFAEILPNATVDSTARGTIENAIKESDTEREHSDRVENEQDKNSKSLNLESETSDKENHIVVESIIIEDTSSNKMAETKENTVDLPSTSNDKVDEHSDALLGLRNISEKCTEVINGADDLLKENVSSNSEEKCEEHSRSFIKPLENHKNLDNLETEICTASGSNGLLYERLSDNFGSREKESEKIVESTTSASELLKEKDSEMELEKTSTNTSESILNEPLKDKIDCEKLDPEKSSEKMIESANNFHELLTEKENFELEESDTSADSASVLQALLALEENSSESGMSSESLHISDELLKQNVIDNLETEESTAKTTELCSNDLLVDSMNLESEECSEKLTNEILMEQVTGNTRLEEFSTKIADDLLVSNELLKEKDAEHVELEGSELLDDNVDSKNQESDAFTNSSHEQLKNNLESGADADSKNLESEKCTEESTKSSNEILKEQVTENMELLKTSSDVAELGSQELLTEKVIENNMEFEESSENVAESSLNKFLQEVGSENLETVKSPEQLLELTNKSNANDKEGQIFDSLDGFPAMDDELVTSLNPPLKENTPCETTKESNELLTENVSELADNVESSPTIDLFDMKKFTDMCLGSVSSSNDLLGEANDISNNVTSAESSKKDSIIIDENCAKLTTNGSDEVVADFESPRVDLSCQSDSANDVIASTINSIEKLRSILDA